MQIYCKRIQTCKHTYHLKRSLVRHKETRHRNWSNQLWLSHNGANKHCAPNQKPQSWQRTSVFKSEANCENDALLPLNSSWTCSQMMPLCLCLTPAWKQASPAILGKIAGYERTWRISAAEVSAGRENTLLPLACDSVFNKRTICCDMLFLSPVDLWQRRCRDGLQLLSMRFAKGVI